jgi:DNA-binding MarR family transcriptional regulator
MAEDTEILREIRELLRLMAEPALAKRDERLRASLFQVVGKSKLKAEAVALMDGTRSQAGIRKDCGIDAGDLSRLVKVLREAGLIGSDDGQLKLVFPLPSNFSDTIGKSEK